MSIKSRLNPELLSSYHEHVDCVVCGNGAVCEPAVDERAITVDGSVLSWRFTACSTCGTLRNDPQWKPCILEWMYDNSYYKTYHPLDNEAISKIIQVNYHNYERHLDELAAITKLERLFDVGCGQGLLVMEAQSRGIDAHGCDLSGTTTEFARNTVGVRNISQGEFVYRPIWDEFFDAITFNDSIEHTPNPASQLDVARRMLRAGGLVSIAVPNCDSPLFAMNKDFFLDPPYHLWGFGRKQLARLVQNAGLEVVAMKSGLYYIGQLWCIAVKR